MAAFHVLVVGKDQVGPFRNQHLGIEPLLSQGRKLLLEAEGIYDHPVPQDVHRMGMDDP